MMTAMSSPKPSSKLSCMTRANSPEMGSADSRIRGSSASMWKRLSGALAYSSYDPGSSISGAGEAGFASCEPENISPIFDLIVFISCSLFYCLGHRARCIQLRPIRA
jgi:hypothetical protein